MLERSHLHLPDELGLNLGLRHDVRHQRSQMAEDEVRFVVGGRGERRHGEAADFHLGVQEHDVEHVDQILLEHCIKRVPAVRERVAQSLNGNATQRNILVPQESLFELVRPRGHSTDAGRGSVLPGASECTSAGR